MSRSISFTLLRKSAAPHIIQYSPIRPTCSFFGELGPAFHPIRQAWVLRPRMTREVQQDEGVNSLFPGAFLQKLCESQIVFMGHCQCPPGRGPSTTSHDTWHMRGNSLLSYTCCFCFKINRHSECPQKPIHLTSKLSSGGVRMSRSSEDSTHSRSAQMRVYKEYVCQLVAQDPGAPLWCLPPATSTWYSILPATSNCQVYEPTRDKRSSMNPWHGGGPPVMANMLTLWASE